MKKTLFAVVVVVAMMVAWLHHRASDQTPVGEPLSLGGLLGEAPAGFSKVSEPLEFEFPKDHAMHPDFRNEWWYFTGRLDAGDRPMGFQFTLFRFGLDPETAQGEDEGEGNGELSEWRSDHLWMAHLALSDGGVPGQSEPRFYQQERFARDGLALAGATQTQWWLKDWTVTATDEGWVLDVMAEDFGLSLTLSPTRPMTLQGDNGFSQKGPEVGNASYYYSHTRLQADGKVFLQAAGDDPIEVDGLAWLDREWGSGQLSDTQSGWDWFAIHLDDGRDVMVYRLRNTDNTMSRFSKGVVVFPDGQKVSLSAEDFSLKPQRWWQDSQGHEWPVAWRMRIPSQQLDVLVEPLFDDQRWYQSVAYWEGAIDVSRWSPDSNAPTRVGRGYLELSGYAEPERLGRRASQTTPTQAQ